MVYFYIYIELGPAREPTLDTQILNKGRVTMQNVTARVTTTTHTQEFLDMTYIPTTRTTTH